MQCPVWVGSHDASRHRVVFAVGSVAMDVVVATLAMLDPIPHRKVEAECHVDLQHPVEFPAALRRLRRNLCLLAGHPVVRRLLMPFGL